MLQYAVSYNYLNTVKYLVEKCGLSIHDLDEDGKSPFHYVNSKEIPDYLVLQGFQVNLCDKYGHVALYYVKLRGNNLVFKELLKLGSIINSSKDIISKYEKEVTEIVENADNIYLGYHVNIFPLINIYDSSSKSSLNYQEALGLISTRLKSLILRSGYPNNIKVRHNYSLGFTDQTRQEKILVDLQSIVNKIVIPTKHQIGETIEVYLAILLYKSNPIKFSSLVPYSILKKINATFNHGTEVYNKYKHKYLHYKIKHCFDYLINPENCHEVLSLLLVDDHNRKLLFQTIKNTILREDDFNKFQILSTKVNNILEIIDQESNDFKLIYNIIKQQCTYAISELDYLQEELQKINEKYEQLKKNIFEEKPKLYVDNELFYNKNGHNKIQSIIASQEISKEKFRQSM